MTQKFRLGSPRSNKTTDWRTYQKTLKKNAKRRRFRRRLPLWGQLSLIIIAIVCAGYGAFVIGMPPEIISARHIDENEKRSENKADDPSQPLDKQAIRQILADIDPNQLDQETIVFEKEGKRYSIKTSIDLDLQNSLINQLRLEHARYLSIVALNPETGRILTMISHDRLALDRNTCLDNRFPAASIFKIVTASAAIETFDLKAHSTMLFNGRKHTLYKSQLKDQQNKWTRRVPFTEAFAQSINPVFGKLGANRLGKEKLLSYAQAFGFNHEFDLDLPMAPSRFAVTDTPYQWAEMASGFNQDTTLSPLHGALIAAAVVNGGRLIEPTLIDAVMDENGKALYRGHPRTVQKAMDSNTAGIISKMMLATVKEGTARKVFRGYSKDRVLSRVDIGGKTGSINNDPRYDWYVGFATDKTSDHSLVVSILVAHEKFIGTKSGQYARMAIKAYFEDYFAGQTPPPISAADNISNG